MGFGNGGDSTIDLSGTFSPIDSSCSGTSGSISLSATNASFAAGQQILIHQTKGTGAGSWEVNFIASYSTGTITTLSPLSNTYTNSGASQAQALVLSQYSQATISGTLTAKAWDGNVGGIITFLCNGKVDILGTITAAGKGFRGGANVPGSDPQQGYAGEGQSGIGGQSTAANGMGGGGAYKDVSGTAGGGGGGHANSGSNGEEQGTGPSIIGSGGGTGGAADLTTLLFGGGGGGTGGAGKNGGAGGGIILIFAKTIITTGNLIANGDDTSGTPPDAGGGGGGGGSIFLKGQNITLGSSLVTSNGGIGTGTAANGGTGSVGRIRIEACSKTGSTSPTASEQIGGFNFCGGASAIIG